MPQSKELQDLPSDKYPRSYTPASEKYIRDAGVRRAKRQGRLIPWDGGYSSTDRVDLIQEGEREIRDEYLAREKKRNATPQPRNRKRGRGKTR